MRDDSQGRLSSSANTAWDWELLSRELVRALRGPRSQVALSRRLRFRSNVIYTWESGRRKPGADDLLRLLKAVGGSLNSPFEQFSVRVADLNLGSASAQERQYARVELMNRLRGDTPVAQVARRCGVSRFVAGRWLNGTTEPRLSEFLAFIEAVTLRVVDFVGSVVEPQSVPSLFTRWREVEARRGVAFRHPWSQAILRQIETSAYRSSKGSSVRWIACRLNVERTVIEDALGALVRAGLIVREGTRYVSRPVAVDTSLGSPEDRRALRRHWAEVGLARIDRDASGKYSWSVVGVSASDFARLEELHVRYLGAVRQLVEASEPSEVVAVLNVQLFPLAAS